MWPEWLRPILSFQLDLLFYHLSFPVLQPHWPSYSPFRVPGSSASGTLYFQLLESFPPSSPTFICPACPYSAFGPQTTFHFLQTSLWLFSPGPVPRGMLLWCSVPFFHSRDHNCHEIFNYTISLQFISPTEMQSSRSMGAGTVFSSPEHSPAYSKQSRHLS